MKAAFIIVTAGGNPKYLSNLLDEIDKIKTSGTKIFVIKNKRFAEGFAQGVNKGLKKAIKEKCDIFIVCNPDITLKGVSFKILTAPAKRFDLWGFAFKQGENTYYGGEIDRWRMSGGLVTRKPEERFQEVDFISGSLICFTKKTFARLGFWDEDFFMYYEDVDYCLRAKKIGLNVGIDSKVVYKHFEESKSNELKDKFLRKARLRFLLKHGTFLQKVYEFLRMPKTISERL